MRHASRGLLRSLVTPAVVGVSAVTAVLGCTEASSPPRSLAPKESSMSEVRPDPNPAPPVADTADRLRESSGDAPAALRTATFALG